ncbi:protein PAXX [Arapaima gigas]
MDHHTRSAYCTVVNKADNTKYLCFLHTKAGVLNVGLTNASNVWITDFTKESLSQHMKEYGLKSIEGYVSKIRSSSGNGCATVCLEENRLVLQLESMPGAMTMALLRLSEPEGREVLRDLLFRMADCLTHLDNTGNVKSFVSSEFEPRRQQTGPVVAVRKRVPGDSLINPGTRRLKRVPTGVAFDDSDDL